MRLGLAEDGSSGREYLDYGREGPYHYLRMTRKFADQFRDIRDIRGSKGIGGEGGERQTTTPTKHASIQGRVEL
tara:strand:+ start:242 stop:463 length:222 start_codon:yes stop_codon:yes gene_type:complete